MCAMMTGADVREVFSVILPDDILMAVVKATGLQQRVRKMDALVLLRTMIISAATDTAVGRPTR